MNEKTDNRELEHRIDLLEKDYKIMEANIDGTLKTMRTDIDGTLNTMRADIDGTLKTMRVDIDKTLHAMRTDMERNNSEVANKIHAQTKWTIGVVAVAVVIIIGAVGLLTQIS